jgi:hypothetical protein
VDSGAPDFRALIKQKFKNELDFFAYGRGKSRAHASISHLTEHVSVSYKGRTLVELIQNAYDPHPASRSDGEISILFDPAECRHGCLYIANRGLGFTPENFEGLCNIADSSKVVNEGIGNKGLGFRSVAQICKHPEIYSSHPSSAPQRTFNGFCFGFPTQEHLRYLLQATAHSSYIDEVIRTMPRSLLPVFLEDRPGHINEFADQGFATVIRMPLDRAEASADVREQIEALCDHELPIHLFLDRIRQIRIDVKSPADTSDENVFCHILPRQIQECWEQDGIHFEIVRVDESAEYLVSKHRLPEEAFRPVLEAGIASKELPESWGNWGEPPEIAVAVSLASPGKLGRLYNFLPMEAVAESPCAAHVNAPFYSDIDRKKLVEKVKLNNYFLKEIASLCLWTAENLKESRPELAPEVVVDLTMWVDDDTEIMVDVAKEQTGTNLAELPLIPSCEGSSAFPWATLDEVFEWPGSELELSTLSPETVAPVAGVAILNPRVSGQRLPRLRRVADYTTGLALIPLPETTANWVEKFAAHLQASGDSIVGWDAFYQDIAALFRDSPRALQGCRILLTEDNKLAPTLTHALAEASDTKARSRQARRDRAIFLPNTQKAQGREGDGETLRGEDELDYENDLSLQIPKSLERAVQIVNKNLACASRNDNTGVREFLIENRLVNQFLTEDIQRLLAQITTIPGRGSDPDKRRLQALRFAFELSGRGAKTAELADMPFHVPTKSNQWVRATRAYFGRSWAGTRGKELAELLKATEHVSEELRAVGENVLREVPDWSGLAKADGKDWSRFLKSLGVRDTLHLANVRPPGALQEQGVMFRTRLLERCNAEGKAGGYWEKELPGDLPNPYTPYTVQGAVPALPGQADFRNFTTSAKLLYANEVLAFLKEFGSSPLTIRVFRPQHPYAPNETRWPSPLASFLRNAKWLPVQSGQNDAHFACPSEAWHLQAYTTNVRPGFLTIVTNDCRSMLDAHPELRETLQEYCGLNIVNSEDSCKAQVRLLAELAANGQIPSAALSAFDSLYAEGWRLLSEDPDTLDAFLDTRPFVIAAHEGTGIVGFELEDDSQEELGSNPTASLPLAYLADDQAPITRDLLKELGRPVFDFKFPKRAEVCGKIHDKYRQLERVSNVCLDILVEGTPFQVQENDGLLSPAERRWLQDTLLVISDLSAGGFLNLGHDAFERLRARISRLRYRLVERINLRIDGEVLTLPEFAQGCLFVNDERSPALLIETSQESLSWGVLQQASYALAESLGYPIHLSSVLSAAFGQLAQRHGAESLRKPSESDLQAVCRKSAQAVRESLRNLHHIVDSLIELLRPAILASAGPNAACQFESIISSVENEADLHEGLKRIGVNWPIAPDTLLEASVQNEELNGLRRDLGINLPKFNSALRGLGPPYRQISFAEEHEQQFKAFLTTRRDQIQHALRARFESAFEAGGDLSDYVTASRLNGLVSDTEWATQYEELPESLMLSRVNDWLAYSSAWPIGTDDPPTSPTVSECCATNRDTLRKFVSEAWAVVAVWCRKHGRDVPDRWRVRQDAPQALVTHIQGQGWLDFVVLDRIGVIKCLEASGNWPTGMPRTLDLEVLSIDPNSLDETVEKARQERAERVRLASIVGVGGLELSADQDDLPEILASLMDNYAAHGLGLEAPAKIVTLEFLEQVSKGQQGHSGTSSSRAMPPRDLPEAQRRIIGLLGERFAFEWIKRQYPSFVNEDSWVSTNRERALQIPGGDDSLGYDFIVNLPSYTLHFEVKASSGEDYFFRLGPTEVETAVHCRADSKRRYRILLVQNVLSPESTRPLLLPNPFSDQFRDRFQLVTKGEQGFRFVPAR